MMVLHKKKKITIFLLESPLELVPRELWRHPAVTKNARRRGKRPGEILLDKSLHFAAMKDIRDHEKRGRPDIVHATLLEIQGSPLNLEGFVETYIHTYTGSIYYIRPETRIPKNYNRFVGLMEQLLIKGRVPPNTDKPLIYKVPEDLPSILARKKKQLLLLDEKAPRISLNELADIILEDKYVIGIGMFPHGDFNQKIKRIAYKRYSIYKKTLESWIVSSRIITAIEIKLDII